MCIIHCMEVKHGTVIKPLSQETKAKLLNCYRLHRIAGSDPKFTAVLGAFPDILDDAVHGFHRYCYHLFKNLKYLRKRSHDDQPSEPEDVSDYSVTHLSQHHGKKTDVEWQTPPGHFFHVTGALYTCAYRWKSRRLQQTPSLAYQVLWVEDGKLEREGL